MSGIFSKINKLKNWQIAVILSLIGFSVFFSGLKSPFQGDDISQVVDNPVIHSLSNIKVFFEGSTFYTGNGIAPLSGTYYRPLETVVYSVLYSLFGSNVIYYHLLQLFLAISSTFLIYLIFKYSFKTLLALFLALIFMLIPINSQVVFTVASMGDILYLFFGLLAIYISLRFQGLKSLIAVSLLLMLSLLSKEAGIVFIFIEAVLLLFFDTRKRLYCFLASLIPIGIIYGYLRIHYVGLFTNPIAAPINNLDISGRLMSAPSIMFLYISKFIFPYKLASAYYFTHSTFSYRYVLLPLIVDLLFIAAVAYSVIYIKRHQHKVIYKTYIFYVIWFFAGIIPLLQLTTLDLTACEAWFYFASIGLIGMIGVNLTLLPKKYINRWLFILGLLLILIFGIRTSLRGLDWNNPINLEYKDIAASSDNYTAYNQVAENLLNRGKINNAKIYALKSVSIYPTNYANTNTLGEIYGSSGNYQAAEKEYLSSIKYGPSFNTAYENLAQLYLIHGSIRSNQSFILAALNKFPSDSTLWLDYAIFEAKYGTSEAANYALSKAINFGNVPSQIIESIQHNKPILVHFQILDANVAI